MNWIISFMTAMPAETAPVIDGELTDACWAKGVPNKIYYKLDVPNPPRVDLKTECTVMYDAKGVYVGIRNWEEDVSKLRKTHLKDWDASLWYDDGGEIYFDPDCSGVGFYKYDLSCTGRHYTLWRMDAANVHTDWRSEGCVSAAKIFDDRFEIELFVPWGDFHGRPAPTPGTLWMFDHNRYQWHKWILCCSSPCAGYTTPQNFGYLYFSDGKELKPDAVLDLLSKKLETEWGIEIGGTTYLHDSDGVRPIEGTITELAVRKEAERKAAEAQATTNFYTCCQTDEPVPALELPLAGQYDFTPPKGYDGYNGWFRHNPSFEKYRTPHLDWGESAAGDPTKVLFIVAFDRLRDMMELETRFPIRGLYFPGNFGASGIWEDAVSGGTHIEKERQFETLLAENPDVVVLSGFAIESTKSIPSRYRTELFRRVRDEGMGLLILGGGWRMPTSAEFTAMIDATYWAWDATDKGYYVFKPGPGTSGSAGGRGTIAGTDDKTKALLFFPAAGRSNRSNFSDVGSYGHYFSSSLKSSDTAYAYGLYFLRSSVNPQYEYLRYSGYTVRPVSD